MRNYNIISNSQTILIQTRGCVVVRHPQRIVALTEEPVEILYLLNKQDNLVGVSNFVKRPKQALDQPRVSAFIKSNYEKIKDLEPDLIIGYSDIQKDIAKDLIEMGFNVYIANHQSVSGILNYVQTIGNLMQSSEAAADLVLKLEKNIDTAKKKAKSRATRPRVYFEEWNNPMISAIGWVKDMLTICGAEVFIAENEKGNLAQGRITSVQEVEQFDPEILLTCWCGKKTNFDEVNNRLANTTAVQNKRVYEIEPEIFLQPGPAPLLDGLDILLDIFNEV